MGSNGQDQHPIFVFRPADKQGSSLFELCCGLKYTFPPPQDLHSDLRRSPLFLDKLDMQLFIVSQGLVASNYVGVTGSSYARGIYLYYSEYQNIHYNSVNLSCDPYYEYDNRAFYTYGGDYLKVKNNIFACTLS